MHSVSCRMNAIALSVARRLALAVGLLAGLFLGTPCHGSPVLWYAETPRIRISGSGDYGPWDFDGYATSALSNPGQVGGGASVYVGSFYPRTIYSPFANVTCPFPEMITGAEYIDKLGEVSFAAYRYQGQWSWDMQLRYSVATYDTGYGYPDLPRDPFTRVFVTAIGAPTPSGEAVVFDSGNLGPTTWFTGSLSASFGSDLVPTGGWNTVNTYAVYAVTPVPVPEPSTYAMALASLGFTAGYSIWQRRRRSRTGEPRPSTSRA